MYSKNFVNLIFICLVCSIAFGGADFDDLSLAPESYWNGSDGSGGFESGDMSFNNSFTDWGGGVTSWESFAYSNISDTSSTGLDAQYNAITGAAHSGGNYAIGFIGFTQVPTVTLNSTGVLDGFYITNNNYAYYTIRDGNPTFGTEPFDDGDWFMLTVIGKDAAGEVVGTVDSYLADFRDGKSEIVDTWKYVDLTSLGAVKSLEFSMDSSDVGQWGINTPTYFALDTIVPEPATMLLLGLGGLVVMRKRQ